MTLKADNRKLFGTDGIRGPANAYPLIPEMVVSVGKAAAVAFKNGKRHPRFVIGKDTRITGYILETALTSGLCSMGADVILVGPMPTPAVAHLVKSLVADAGIVLTASHNPADDNGIKFFSKEGIKLPDKVEMKIEKLIFSNKLDSSRIKGDMIGKAYRVEDASGRYIEYVKNTVRNKSLSGMKIVLDCANGASYKIAPKVFSELGADVVVINNNPDGLNINSQCGALYTKKLGEVVKKKKADVGMAFDGDADRIIIVDEKGMTVDGDHVLFQIAKDHKKRGALDNDTIVITQYSNLALDSKLEEYGIKTLRVDNGDRYVIDAMLKHGHVVGGEKSGHIILSKHSTTGDGIVSALHMAKIMKSSGLKMSELTRELKFYPQILRNVLVRKKKPLDNIKGYSALKEGIEAKLGQSGRLFVRYSGTENKCRIMLEGKDKKQIEAMADKVEELIKADVGL